MAEDPSLHVELEIEQGEPMTGWLAAAGEPPRRFEGVLELMAGIDRLREPHDPDAPAAV